MLNQIWIKPILLIGEHLHLCVLVIYCVLLLEIIFKFKVQAKLEDDA